MTLDASTIGAAAVGLGLIASGVWSGWTSHQARREAKRAAQNSHPISNGWGTSLRNDMSSLTGDVSAVLQSMHRLHLRMDESDRRNSEQDARMSNQDRLLAETTAAARTAAEQSSAVATGLSTHLADHASAGMRGAEVTTR